MGEYGHFRTKKLADKYAKRLKSKGFKKVSVKKVKRSPEGLTPGYKVYAYWR